MSPISSRNSEPWSASSNLPFLLYQRSGEGSLLVPEHFAFEQSRGNGGAVHANEGAAAPATQVVNGICNQLLPRTRLAVKQNGCIRRRNDGDLFQHFLNGRALSDDAFEAVLSSSPIPGKAAGPRCPSFRESLLCEPSRIRESNTRVAHIILLAYLSSRLTT